MDDFLELLEEWKKSHWILYASQTSKNRATRKRFWCNLDKEYKITLKSKKDPIYQGDNMEEAYKTYKML